MTHPWVDLSVIVSENRRLTHTGQKKTLPVTTLGAPPHYGKIVRDYLDDPFVRWIGRRETVE